MKQRGAAAAPDPHAPPSVSFTLRLNEYQLQLLQRAAGEEFCSQQAVAKRILMRGLEETLSKALVKHVREAAALGAEIKKREW